VGDTPQERRGWSYVLPAIVLGGYAAVVLLGCVEREWRPEWDSAIYLLTARSLAAGTGYAYLGQPFFLRPPGFSWALSFLAHDGRFDFAELNFWLMVSAVAATGAAYLALRRTEGPNRALAATMLMATCPLFVARFNWVDSDLPFMALFFGAMCLFDVAAREAKRGVGACVGGSLLLTAAIYVRTMGAALLPGAVLLFFFRRRGGHRVLLGIVAGLIPALLYVPWLQQAGRAAASADRPAEQLMLFDYATATLRVDPGDPDSDALSASDWMERIEINAAHLVSDLSACVLGTRREWASTLLVVVLLLGFGRAVMRGPTLLEWHAATSTVLLLTKMLFVEPETYFRHESRLIVPVLPAVYAYVMSGVDGMRRRIGRAWGTSVPGDVVAAAAVGGLLLGNFTLLPQVLHPRAIRLAVGTVGDTWDDYPRSAQWLREHTPEGAVIMTEAAPIVSVLSGRRVYTNRFARAPDLLGRYGVDYVLGYGWAASELENDVAARAEQRWLLPSHTAGRTIRIYKVAK
jgi:hypothetical protein